MTNGNSVWEDFKHWHKGFSRSKAAKYRGKDREFLEILRKELCIINNKIMRKNDRLPNVIFMSPKASELIESLTTEDEVLFETEANGISVKMRPCLIPTWTKHPNIATLFNCGIQPESNRIS